MMQAVHFGFNWDWKPGGKSGGTSSPRPLQARPEATAHPPADEVSRPTVADRAEIDKGISAARRAQFKRAQVIALALLNQPEPIERPYAGLVGAWRRWREEPAVVEQTMAEYERRVRAQAERPMALRKELDELIDNNPGLADKLRRVLERRLFELEPTITTQEVREVVHLKKMWKELERLEKRDSKAADAALLDSRLFELEPDIAEGDSEVRDVVHLMREIEAMKDDAELASDE